MAHAEFFFAGWLKTEFRIKTVCVSISQVLRLLVRSPVLAGTPVKNCVTLLRQSFTVHMLLLAATGTFDDARVRLVAVTYTAYYMYIL